MSRKKSYSPEQVRAAIEDIKARLNALPRIAAGDFGDIMDSHRAYRAAQDELVAHVTAAYGARISVSPVTCRVSMMGLTVTCTSGPAAALKRWVQRMTDLLSEPIAEDLR